MEPRSRASTSTRPTCSATALLFESVALMWYAVGEALFVKVNVEKMAWSSQTFTKL